MSYHFYFIPLKPSLSLELPAGYQQALVTLLPTDAQLLGLAHATIPSFLYRYWGLFMVAQQVFLPIEHSQH